MMRRYALRFREGDGGGPALKTGVANQEQAAIPDRPLFCHACGQVITSEAVRRPVAGAEVHERTNPAGYRYCFGCFSTAPGCATIGEPDGEHSWFAGCAWCLALCGACGEHLGWHFSGADEFFGLILDRLTRTDE